MKHRRISAGCPGIRAGVLLLALLTIGQGQTQAQSIAIPRDTSYTIRSAYLKLKKNYPAVHPIEPVLPPYVQQRLDVVYRRLGGRELHLDLFFPPLRKKHSYPGVLLIHGGGWSSGSKAHQVPMAQQLARRGYVAAAVEYRLSPEAIYPAAVQDLKEAVRWLRAHAGEYGLDTVRIAVLGCSAGAQLASLLGATNGQPRFEQPTALPRHSAAVQAVVNIDGIVSFIHPEASAEGSAAAKWLGGSRTEAFQNWREASPLEYVDAHTPPFLFINSAIPRFHAGRDDFISRLTEYGAYSEVHSIPDSPHSFWLVHPWFEETLRYTYCFLDKTLRGNSLGIDTMAERMLVYQRAIGGWPKSYFTADGRELRITYNRPLTEGSDDEIRADSLKADATYDNSSTSREINYLIKAYSRTGNTRYLQAAEKGIRYILMGQYADSGGWPQSYPLRRGYYSHITFNDHVISNNLNILYNVAHGLQGFDAVDPALIRPSRKAVKKGIDCILRTQIRQAGVLTGWCQQHDERTLEPAGARSFELPSLSGQESVGVVEFLMRLEHPSARVKQAIVHAVDWLERSKIEGYAYEFIDDPDGPRGLDRVFIPKAGAVSWARFYDLNTNEPFFCGRDGIKKESVAEIEQERRVGYAWYGDWARDLLEKEYPRWRAAHL